MGGWNAMRHSLPTADVHSRTFPFSLSFLFHTQWATYHHGPGPYGSSKGSPTRKYATATPAMKMHTRQGLTGMCNDAR